MRGTMWLVMVCMSISVWSDETLLANGLGKPVVGMCYYVCGEPRLLESVC